jgi:hypothetical protein
MAGDELRVKPSVARDVRSPHTEGRPKAIKDVQPVTGAPAADAIRHSSD